MSVSRGHCGVLEHVEIDTNHFKGNFPESCELHAINSAEVGFSRGPGAYKE